MSEPRVALVTGSARRIGRHIAERLAAAGWAVAVHHRRSGADAADVVAGIRAAGGRAEAFAADLADEAACRALVPAVRAAFGRVDAVVNNASLFEHDGVADFGFAAMERHWRANTAAPVLLARALHAAGGSVVVNLLDQKLWNLNPDHFSYTLSKAALETATRMLAMALAPGVRVCGVAPGLVLGSDMIDEDRLAQLATRGPLGRLASIDDVAASVRFLLETPSITGCTLLVDAGAHLVRSERDYAFQATGDTPSGHPPTEST